MPMPSPEVMFNFTSSTEVASFFFLLSEYFIYEMCFFIEIMPEFIPTKMSNLLSMIILFVFTFMVSLGYMDQHSTYNVRRFFVASVICLVVCLVHISRQICQISRAINNYKGYSFWPEEVVVFTFISFVLLIFGLIILFCTLVFYRI